MPDPASDTAKIMARIEALVMTAAVNAANTGGDHATAATDLMCAFVLISMRMGTPPEEAIEISSQNAIAACRDFWGQTGRKLDA
ncbi:hypothetical protein DSD19_04735 [Rhodovulum sp. BSW8]|uniref:hypothetical protein n=1 Tax=Rhodovulum sp. BSW8 TaxID=2259645 RepID=UPI000DE1C0A7|nr:hypothetical protein [Rhodovulum sp. BSW8]RBO54686.1 hypothetical protein DSD19_04735 [Rhodovulum sp. BSW8]